MTDCVEVIVKEKVVHLLTAIWWIAVVYFVIGGTRTVSTLTSTLSEPEPVTKTPVVQAAVTAQSPEPMQEVESMLCLWPVPDRVEPITLCLHHDGQDQPMCDVKLYQEEGNARMFCSEPRDTTNDWGEDDSMIRISIDPQDAASVVGPPELVLFNRQVGMDKWYATMRLGPPNLLDESWVALVGRLYGTTLTMYLPDKITESAEVCRGYESEIQAASRGPDMSGPAVAAAPVRHRRGQPHTKTEQVAKAQQPVRRLLGLGMLEGGTSIPMSRDVVFEHQTK